MTNIAKRNLALVMVIIGIITLLGLVLGRIILDNRYETWQFISAPLWIFFFYGMYRNYSQAVKEDRKYGPRQ